MTPNEKVHAAIHTASAAAAAVGAGLAQLPGSDAPVLATIQAAMIGQIARAHGKPVSDAAAAQLVLTFGAVVGGRFLSQLFIGWIPGWGNAVNATTAAALTEAIGWAAHAYFAEAHPVLA